MTRRLGTSARDRRSGTHQGRFLAVVLLVTLCFAALVGRLGQVQLVGHDDFRAAAAAPDTRELALDVSYMGCADAGLCYPPTTRRITVALGASPPDATS